MDGAGHASGAVLRIAVVQSLTRFKPSNARSIATCIRIALAGNSDLLEPEPRGFEDFNSTHPGAHSPALREVGDMRGYLTSFGTLLLANSLYLWLSSLYKNNA